MTPATPAEFSIALDDTLTTSARVYQNASATDSGATVILAHGAGAGQTSRFMVSFAEGLSARGLRVVTFNFAYSDQGRRAPDRAPKLEACSRVVTEWVRADAPERALFIGGKSMGGRIATQIAAAPAVDDVAGHAAVVVSGVIALGYPLHPPGRPEKLRDAHLPRISPPVLIVQGARDPFGTETELRQVLTRMQQATLHIIDGGDHSLSIRRKSAPPKEMIYSGVMDTVRSWVGQVGG